jgi:toxin ParE1/3/4
VKYILSLEAGHDITDIEDYTALTWGDGQAEVYIHELFEAFQKLAGQPHLGRFRPDVPAPYLVYAVGSHLIIYRINQAREQVEVLNILHPAMDIEKRLKEALRGKRDQG